MTATNTNLTTAAGLKPGDKIDKYEVVQQIGAGGFSVVWKAYDRLLDQHVAVKQVTVDPSVDEDTFRERFRAEAVIQKKAAGDHKHLVRIIDYLEDPRGLFIVMEYVDGPSLEHLLAQNPGPVDVKTALGIAAAAAVALGAIHEKGIIHRDLKPANVLLPNSGGLKICDFGLASLMVDQEVPAVGTVRYMAPELLNGQKADGRADIYSLGMILYEMLIGRANFEDAFKIVLRDQRNVALRWMKWHTNVKVKAPPIRQYVPSVPEPIAQLVERMMEKDVNQRIASAPQLLDAMRRQLSAPTAAAAATPTGKGGRPSAFATPGAAGDKTVKLAKKNKLVLIAAVTIIVWSVLGIGYLLYTQKQASDQLRAAQRVVKDDYFSAVKSFQVAVRDGTNWDKVAVAFKEVVSKHEDHHDLPVPVYDDSLKPLEQAAEGHRLFCDARVEYDRKNFGKAIELLNKAEKQGSVELKLINKVRMDAEFLLVLDEMERRILADVDKEAYFNADHLLKKVLSEHASQFTKEQKDRWEELRQRIEAQKESKEGDKVIKEARRLEETNPAAAEELLASFLAKNVDNPNRLVKAELDRMRGANEFLAAVQRGRSAEQRMEWDLAIESYNRAIALNARKADEMGLPKAINKIMAIVLVGKARVALTENRPEDALRDSSAASSYDPDNEEAKKIQAQIGAAARIAELRRQAVIARESKEYEKAINLWKQLRELGEDATAIAAEIAADELQIALGKMEKAWASDVDDAEVLKLINEVLALDSGNARAASLKSLIDSRKKIRDLIVSGDKRLAEGQYGDSKRDFRKAEDIAKAVPDEAIRDQLLRVTSARINEAEFRDYLSKAKNDYQLEKYDTSWAWIKNALNAKPNDEEAKAWLVKIEAAKAKQNKQ